MENKSNIKDIDHQLIAIGKVMGLKFDERFSPDGDKLIKAVEKVIKINHDLRREIRKIQG